MGVKVTFLPHEELISKLDSVSKLYQVVVIKTALTLPYIYLLNWIVNIGMRFGK